MSKMMKSHRVLAFAVILGLVVLFLAACASQPASSSISKAPLPQKNSDGTIINSTQSGSTPTAVATIVSQNNGTAKSDVSFSRDIMPLLQTSCISCHGGEKTSKGLDLKTFAGLMAGSQFGPVIVPGDAANSKMVQSVQSGKMPKRGAKLTPDQIQLLLDWVNGGAKDN
jgi:cytochrome c553